MLSAEDANSGIWTTWYDYDRSWLSRSQILVTDNASQYLTNWIAVFLGLSIPCAYIILRRLALTISPLFWQGLSSLYHLLARRPRPGTPDSDSEDIPLVQLILDQLRKPGDEDNPLRAIQIIGTGISDRIVLEDDDGDSEEPLSLWGEILKSIRSAGPAIQKMWNEPVLFIAICIVVCFFALLFVGGAYVSVISAALANDSVLSSASPSAGLWESDTSSAAFLLGDGAVIAEDRQARTWAYKNACYHADENEPACNMFYKQRIPYKSYPNTACPFEGDACLFGNQSAFTVDTGLLDTNILGINAPSSKRFFFQRTMSCAPLPTDERYIGSSGDGSSAHPNQWLYNYGPFTSGSWVWDNATYRTPREWSLLDAHPADIQDYVLEASWYDPIADDGNFRPLPEFRSGNATVTIMFISTGGFRLHVFERSDPIFPAPEPVLVYIGEGTYSTFWWNNSTRAGVLGCADSFRVCADARGSLCWDMANSSAALAHYTSDLARQRTLFLTLVALNGSNAQNTLNYRGAAALNATKQIQRYIGIRLAAEQWKVEVENIFEAALAGMQVRAFDYARGTYERHSGAMIDRTPDFLRSPGNSVRAAVEISRMFKFRNAAYTNVSAVGFWGVNALCVAVFLGSRRFSSAKRRAEVTERYGGDGGYHDNLWGTIAWKLVVVKPVRGVWKWIREKRQGVVPVQNGEVPEGEDADGSAEDGSDVLSVV